MKTGTRREKLKATNEFATMLRDMAPDNAFDPRTMWDPEEEARQIAIALAEEEAAKATKGGKKKKQAKGSKKSNKKGDIIAKNVKKQEKDKIEKDMIMLKSKIRLKGSSGREAIASLTLKTPQGQLAQMQALLSSSWEEARPPPSTQSERLRVAIDILDTLWETESFLKKLSMKDMDAVKKFMKDNRKLLENAREKREEIKSLYKYCKIEKEILEYKKLDLIAFQLVHMYDRLPPLSMVHTGKWSLDDWQKRVLTHIDEGRSVVVSAPTSSGKTVLYV